MESSTKQHVFSLSSSNKARVEYEKKNFLFHSHLDGTKAILLNHQSMLTLLAILPFFQKELATIQKDIDEKISESAKLNISGEPNTITFPPNGLVKSSIVQKSKIFEATVNLSIYNNKTYLWLNLCFETNDRITGKLKNCVCNGGSILNDVDVNDLSNFVNQCIL